MKRHQRLMNCKLSFFAAVWLSLISQSNQAEPIDCLIEPHMVIEVGSPAMGIVDHIPVQRGDRVKKHQTIAVLNHELETVAVKLAEAQVELTTQQHQRLESLNQQSMASLEQLQQAFTDLKVAKLELERRRIILNQKTIKSPVKGVIVEKLLSPGEYVYEQTPVLRVAQINPLNVETLIPNEYYGKIRKGMTATILPELPVSGEHEAKVELIDAVLDAASGTFGVQLKLPNDSLKLPAGLKCTLTFNHEASLTEQEQMTSSDILK